MKVLLLSMPDYFGHMPPAASRSSLRSATRILHNSFQTCPMLFEDQGLCRNHNLTELEKPESQMNSCVTQAKIYRQPGSISEEA